MTSLDFSDIGERVAFYRKANRWNGEELATRAGNGITRAVLANIETGRKKELTVVEALALAQALEVPLVALLFDVFDPTALTSMVDDEGKRLPVWRAVQWISAEDFPEATELESHRASLAVRYVRERVEILETREAILEAIRGLESRDLAGSLDERARARLTFLREDLERVEREVTDSRANFGNHGIREGQWDL